MRAPTRITRWLSAFARPGQARRAAEEDSRHLLETYGGQAYYEARSRARKARADRQRDRDRHWSRVARTIAQIEGREIGLKAADRWQ